MTTRKGELVYVHVLSESDTAIALLDFERRITKASLLGDERVDFEQSGLGTIVKLPENTRDPIDTIVVLTTVSDAG